MARLARPDGVELHWETRGAGRPVVIVPHWAGVPRLLARLHDDLARDHRVLAYHLRGTGDSTRTGPYDQQTDAADLEAVLTEAEGRGSVALGIADAANRAIQVGARRPDLIAAVVISNANPLGRSARAPGDEALSGSPAVLQTMLRLLETSFRAGLRSMMEGTNPTFAEAEVLRRVDEVAGFCAPEAAVGRLRAWIERQPEAETRELGERLWWLVTDTNPWLPSHLEQRLPDVLPKAHVEHIDDGPVNRPDLTAAVVRRLTKCTRPARLSPTAPPTRQAP